jgi:hypothetical protein
MGVYCPVIVINTRVNQCTTTLLHEIGHAVGLSDDLGNTFMKQGCGDHRKIITESQSKSLAKSNF